MNNRYKGFWNESMMANHCQGLPRENLDQINLKINSHCNAAKNFAKTEIYF